MPLPFHQKEVRMANNCVQAVNLLNGLLHTLTNTPQMEKDHSAFMEKVLRKVHTSPVTWDQVNPKEKPWEVFDSSVEHKEVSLIIELLPGPDMMNSLLGVLIHFQERENCCDMWQKKCSTLSMSIHFIEIFCSCFDSKKTQLENLLSRKPWRYNSISKGRLISL